MEFHSNSTSDPQKDLTKWSKRYTKILSIENEVYFINMAILLVCSSITFLLVIYKRKTRDLFALVSLSSYVFASILLTIYTFVVYFDQGKPDYLDTIRKFEVFESFGTFCYLLAHWAFSSQYLKTSHVLPSLLN